MLWFLEFLWWASDRSNLREEGFHLVYSCSGISWQGRHAGDVSFLVVGSDVQLIYIFHEVERARQESGLLWSSFQSPCPPHPHPPTRIYVQKLPLTFQSSNSRSGPGVQMLELVGDISNPEHSILSPCAQGHLWQLHLTRYYQFFPKRLISIFPNCRV